jgi:hypothetical protein
MNKETEYFEWLKKEVAETFRKSFPYCTSPIEEWKGQEITDFQEDLLKKVKAQISEKWFYTHIRQRGDKLPRIDMLNLLCQYAGYHNWAEFVNRKKGVINPVSETAGASGTTGVPETKVPRATAAAPGRKRNYRWIFPLIGVTVAAVAMMIAYKNDPPRKFRGCLEDITGAVPSDAGKVEVLVFRDKESPVVVKCDSLGCFDVESSTGRIKFIIRSPYYSTDTIVRVLNSPGQTESVKVRTDDYALMIHYFSTSNVSDWKKRRMQLDDMITDDARIYQVYEGSAGMELYNKDEFVDRMTMPLKSLKNIEIIETNYENGRINKLKFKLHQVK